MDCRKALLQWAVKHAGGTMALAERVRLPVWTLDRYHTHDVRIPDSVFLKLVDYALESKPRLQSRDSKFASKKPVRSS